MEDEKKVEVEEVIVEDGTEDEVIETKKPGKVKAWLSRHKTGLTRVAKCAALVGGGLLAGLLIAAKKADNEEALELVSVDWDPDYLPEAESEDEDSDEEDEEES